MNLKKCINNFFKKHRLGFDDLTIILLLLPLTFIFITELIMSLDWRMVHDTPLLHYVAFLIDQHDYVPYKDVFETSMPGTFLFHLAIGKLFGYGDLAFRFVDIAWLLALLCVTWGIMRRFGKRVAWASVILFGLLYFQHGPRLSLQRDYIGIFPIGLAVFFAISRIQLRLPPRSFLIGFLFGLAASIKPHLAIGLPLILFFQWKQVAHIDNDKVLTKSPSSTALSIILFSFTGFAIPILGSILWLWQQGSLPYFWEMFSSYLPLHLKLTGGHRTISGMDKLIYLIKSYRGLGGGSFLLVAACLGTFIAFFDARLSSSKKSVVYLLSGLTILYSIYPVFSGQFWSYHWMPFRYFVILLASLILVRLPSQYNSLFKRLFPVFVLGITVCFTLHPSGEFFRQIRGLPPAAPKGGRVDEIADFLKSHLKPGDKVQSLDWTGGAGHAMLLSKAEVATPFIYDYHFYHHISNPYIQTLRQRFIQKLKQENPKFIIEILTNKPWVSGVDTTREFKELRNILTKDYSISLKDDGDGYIIYERR